MVPDPIAPFASNFSSTLNSFFILNLSVVSNFLGSLQNRPRDPVDAGSIEPGVKMRKDEHLLEIRLHAPLTSGSQTISIIDDDNSLFISVPQAPSEITKSLITVLAKE